MKRQIALLALFLLFGCLEEQYEIGCCSQVNDANPDDDIPGQCEYVWNGTHQVPLGSYFSDMVGGTASITSNECDLVCNISISFQKGGELKEKTFTIPLCQAYEEISCLPRSCSAMVCGDFRFRAKAEATASEYLSEGNLTNMYPTELGYKGEGVDSRDVINLLNARCKFTVIDKRLERQMIRSGGFINSFRVGAGSTYAQFDIARYYIPTSDYACSINPQGLVDRYMNYLNYSGYAEPPGSDPYAEFTGFFYNVTTCVFSSKQEFEQVFSGMQYPPAFDNASTFENESGKYAMVKNLSAVPYNKSSEMINKSFYRVWLRKTNKINPATSTYPFECISGRDCLSAFCTKNDYDRGACFVPEAPEGERSPTCDCREYPYDDAVDYYGDYGDPDYYYTVCSAYTETSDPIEVDFLYRGSIIGNVCLPTYNGTIAPKIFFTYVPCNGAPPNLIQLCDIATKTLGVGYATMNESAFKETTFYKACEPNYIVLSEFVDAYGNAPYNFSETCPPTFASSSPVEDKSHPNTDYDEDTALFNFSVRLAACLPEHPYVPEGDNGLEQYPEYISYDACNPSSLNWPFCLPVSGIHWEGTDQEDDRQHGCFYFYRDLILIRDTGKCLPSDKGIYVDEFGWCEPCTLLSTAMEKLKINHTFVGSEYHFAPNASYMYSKTSQYLAEGIMPIIDASDPELWYNWEGTHTFSGSCSYAEDSPESFGFMSLDGCVEKSGKCICEGQNPNFFNAIINESGPVLLIVANLTYFDIGNEDVMDEAMRRGLVTRYLCKSCLPAIRVKADTIQQKNEVLSAYFGLPSDEESCFSFVSRVMDSQCNQKRLSSVELIVTEFQPGKGELAPAGANQTETNKLILGKMTNFTHTTLIRYSKVTFVDDISACLGSGDCWPENDWAGLQSFYMHLLQNQENLISRGFIGIHFQNWSGASKGNYMAVQGTGDDGLKYSEMKSKLYCSFASPTYFLIHGPPTTYYNRVFASENVTCVPASMADYLKYCGGSSSCNLRQCDDGQLCTCPEGTSCSSNPEGWKCPEGQVTNQCTDCSSIGPQTCTLVYQNGSIEQKIYPPDQLQYYPEIIASLQKPNKCCLSQPNIDPETGEVLSTIKYTFYKSVYQRLGAVPIVFSLRGMIDEQCLMSSFIEENEDFCGATLPSVPYRIERCG
ncbi:MAG: hypothetical protein QW035_04230 [Candidatus Anstonellales archaeon]